MRRGSTQMGRLFASPFGFLKCAGSLVLMVAVILIVIALMAMLLSGHISHV